jgi:hypothetical protein
VFHIKEFHSLQDHLRKFHSTEAGKDHIIFQYFRQQFEAELFVLLPYDPTVNIATGYGTTVVISITDHRADKSFNASINFQQVAVIWLTT